MEKNLPIKIHFLSRGKEKNQEKKKSTNLPIFTEDLNQNQLKLEKVLESSINLRAGTWNSSFQKRAESQYLYKTLQIDFPLIRKANKYKSSQLQTHESNNNKEILKKFFNMQWRSLNSYNNIR